MVLSPASGFRLDRRPVPATPSVAIRCDTSGLVRCPVANGPATRPTDAVTHQLPAVANREVIEAVDQPASVRITADEFLPRISQRRDLIDNAFKFDP
jgi:hypothetical protein